jgi:hypothetical protein
MFHTQADFKQKQRQLQGTALSVIQEPAQATPGARDCAYRLFRNNQRSELRCAVPENLPIPQFVGLEQWTFERVLRPSEPLPPGFHLRAADAGVQFNGFYLFQLTNTHG